MNPDTRTDSDGRRPGTVHIGSREYGRRGTTRKDAYGQRGSNPHHQADVNQVRKLMPPKVIGRVAVLLPGRPGRSPPPCLQAMQVRPDGVVSGLTVRSAHEAVSR
jgi:hypothetical protein